MVKRKSHECKFEDKLIEMHGDIKSLVTGVKAMNGSLKDTKNRFDIHEKESIPFRKSVTEIWAGIHFGKWIIGGILASGLLYHMVAPMLIK